LYVKFMYIIQLLNSMCVRENVYVTKYISNSSLKFLSRHECLSSSIIIGKRYMLKYIYTYWI